MRYFITLFLVFFSMLPIITKAQQMGGKCVDGDCENGRGIVSFQDGATYQGKFKNKQQHGKGKYTASDGSSYEGEWVNGKWNGEGKLITPEGDVWVGTFKNNEGNGLMKVTRRNGEKLEGTMVNSIFTGDGAVWEKTDGTVLRGKWDNGKLLKSGFVKIETPNGTYEGNMENNKRHGYGVFTYKDGHVYKGEWANGEMTGKGIIQYPNGKVYEGYFANGKKVEQGY